MTAPDEAREAIAAMTADDRAAFLAEAEGQWLTSDEVDEVRSPSTASPPPSPAVLRQKPDNQR